MRSIVTCRDQIEQGIVSLLSFIEKGADAGRGPATHVAIGADHGGFG